MNAADNIALWQSQVESTLKTALSAPGADAPVAFTQGLLCGLLAMNQKSATLGLAFAEEALLKQAGAPGSLPDLNPLVEVIGAAVERGLDLRVEALRAELLAELRR